VHFAPSSLVLASFVAAQLSRGHNRRGRIEKEFLNILSVLNDQRRNDFKTILSEVKVGTG
jgi:hypothetical protein